MYAFLSLQSMDILSASMLHQFFFETTVWPHSRHLSVRQCPLIRLRNMKKEKTSIFEEFFNLAPSLHSKAWNSLVPWNALKGRLVELSILFVTLVRQGLAALMFVWSWCGFFYRWPNATFLCRHSSLLACDVDSLTDIYYTYFHCLCLLTDMWPLLRMQLVVSDAGLLIGEFCCMDVIMWICLMS